MEMPTWLVVKTSDVEPVSAREEGIAISGDSG